MLFFIELKSVKVGYFRALVFDFFSVKNSFEHMLNAMDSPLPMKMHVWQTYNILQTVLRSSEIPDEKSHFDFIQGNADHSMLSQA